MKIKLKGIHPHNRTIPEDDRGRCYDIGNITAQVRLSEEGLTLVITEHSYARFLHNDLKLRRFKGIIRNKK